MKEFTLEELYILEEALIQYRLYIKNVAIPKAERDGASSKYIGWYKEYIKEVDRVAKIIDTKYLMHN